MDLHTLEKPLGPCCSLLPPPGLGPPTGKGTNTEGQTEMQDVGPGAQPSTCGHVGLSSV